VIILDSLLTGGIRFVLDKIATAVDRELNDEGALREELLALQMRLELGEIDDDELAVRESELMARLREVRELRRAERAAGEGLESAAGGGEAESAGAGGGAAPADAGGAGRGGALSFDPRRHTIGVEVNFGGAEERD
jgi:hypothetical protein